MPDKPDGSKGDPLTVSGFLIRKQIETAGREHSATLTAAVAAALHHSEQTVKRYYTIDSTRRQKTTSCNKNSRGIQSYGKPRHKKVNRK